MTTYTDNRDKNNNANKLKIYKRLRKYQISQNNICDYRVAEKYHLYQLETQGDCRLPITL